MSSSLRIDTTELIAGALVIGDTGLGIAGASIPASGTHGPAFAYDSVVLQPGYASKEYRATIDSMPQGLTLTAGEDSSFTATAADGVYVLPFTLYEDGQAVGSSSVTLHFGP